MTRPLLQPHSDAPRRLHIAATLTLLAAWTLAACTLAASSAAAQSRFEAGPSMAPLRPDLDALPQNPAPTAQVPVDDSGYVKGTVTDAGNALIPFAHVTLTLAPPNAPRRAVANSSGEFLFPNVPPGPFTVTVDHSGFQTGSANDTLLPGQHDELPPISLRIATADTEVTVTLTKVELAEEEVKTAEQQRAFGIIPEFLIVYTQDPVSLNAKQKFKLAARGAVDPFNLFSSGVVAGVQQATNSLPGYHQGMEGYGKRYGADLATFVSGTLLRVAFYPSLFRQDPRYHFRGPGDGPEHTTRTRITHALLSGVICYGDNGKRQINYSGLAGNLSAGALANLYYPAGSQNGISTTLVNGLLATAGVGAGHLLQEYISDFVPSHHAAEAQRKAAQKAEKDQAAKQE